MDNRAIFSQGKGPVTSHPQSSSPPGFYSQGGIPFPRPFWIDFYSPDSHCHFSFPLEVLTLVGRALHMSFTPSKGQSYLSSCQGMMWFECRWVWEWFEHCVLWSFPFLGLRWTWEDGTRNLLPTLCYMDLSPLHPHYPYSSLAQFQALLFLHPFALLSNPRFWGTPFSKTLLCDVPCFGASLRCPSPGAYFLDNGSKSNKSQVWEQTWIWTKGMWVRCHSCLIASRTSLQVRVLRFFLVTQDLWLSSALSASSSTHLCWFSVPQSSSCQQIFYLANGSS